MKKPRILIWDIESSKQKLEMLGWFRTGKPIFPDAKNVTDVKIHCIGYKWLGEKKTYVISVHDFKANFKKNPLDDSMVIKEFNKILKTADASIGHNLKSFDMKHVNTRILLNGLEPLIFPHPIDTLLLARSNFNLKSNRLDMIAQSLGLSVRKSPMCDQDWIDCFNGKLAAFKKMAKYCKKDIELTEAVYNELYPHVRNHPKISRIMGYSAAQAKGVCPKCASASNIKQGTIGTTSGIKQLRKCKDCNKVFEAEVVKNG